MNGAIERISSDAFARIEGWDKLTQSKKVMLRESYEKAADVIDRLGKDRLALGRFFADIGDVLSANRQLRSFLRETKWGFSPVTFHRIRAEWLAMRTINMPDPVLRRAALKGIQKLPTELIKAYPRVWSPPRTEDVNKIDRYLDELMAAGRQERNTLVRDYDYQVRQVVNRIRYFYNGLPESWSAERKMEAMREVCGMALAVAGGASQQMIQPIAPPPVRPVGAPRKKPVEQEDRVGVMV